MKLKVQFLFALICLFCFSGKAQTDSTDLNFYSTPLELLTLQDTILYFGGDFGELHLEFELGNPSLISVVHLELSSNNSTILYRRRLTISELEESNVLVGNDFSLSIGNYALTNSYNISVTIEKLNGTSAPVLTKTILP